MARIGKIARLPGAVRAQLNSRLQDGGEGKQILQWLNSLPEVRNVLAERFDGRPVTEQNLSDWRLGGHQEWLAQQDIIAQAAELAAHRKELETAAPGQSPAELLADAVSFRYGAILAGQGPELDSAALIQLRALGQICHAVVKLRRGDQNAARLKIETERWEFARQKIRVENEDETKRKLRETLAAPILAMMKVPEWHEKLGGSPMAGIVAGVLREIESCPDPAHFSSKILCSRSQEEWAEYLKEYAKNPPVRKTPIQAALETYREMEIGLGLRRAGKKAACAKRGTKPRRRARKPAKPQPRRCKAKPRRKDVASSLRLDTAQPPDEAEAGTPRRGVHSYDVASSLRLEPEPSESSHGSTESRPAVEAEDVASSLRLDSASSAPPPPDLPEAEIHPNRA